jgi:ankyrin repeat protein
MNLFESFGAPKLNDSQAIGYDLSSSSFMPNKLDDRGFAPIHYCAASGNIEALRALSSKPRASPFIQDKEGNTALHWAVRNVHMILASMLIQSALALLNVVNAAGESALHWAVRNGDDDVSVKIALLLIQRGASVSVQDANGVTPLHLAIADGHNRMTALLLQAQADPLLATVDDALTPLHFAAIYNRPPVIRALSQMGVPLNPRDDEGDTPLHWASRANSKEALAALTSLGADSSLVNVDGESPAEFCNLRASDIFVTPAPLLSSDSMILDAKPNHVSRVQCTPAPAFNSPFSSYGVFVQ